MRALFVFMLGVTGCGIYALFFSTASSLTRSQSVLLCRARNCVVILCKGPRKGPEKVTSTFFSLVGASRWRLVHASVADLISTSPLRESSAASASHDRFDDHAAVDDAAILHSRTAFDLADHAAGGHVGFQRHLHLPTAHVGEDGFDELVDAGAGLGAERNRAVDQRSPK